jgi:ribokinase
MAAKLGCNAAMVGKVGADSNGDETFKNFASLNVSTKHLTVTTEAASGVAPIFVHETSGENLIVVVAGANNLLSTSDVEAATPEITNAKVRCSCLDGNLRMFA